MIFSSNDKCEPTNKFIIKIENPFTISIVSIVALKAL